MAKAVWKGVVPAQSDACVLLEGNHYLPAEPVRPQFLRPSDHQTVCLWKRLASCYEVVVDKEVNVSAAWYYPAASEAARQIQGRIHFWKGVRVEG